MNLEDIKVGETYHYGSGKATVTVLAIGKTKVFGRFGDGQESGVSVVHLKPIVTETFYNVYDTAAYKHANRLDARMNCRFGFHPNYVGTIIVRIDGTKTFEVLS